MRWTLSVVVAVVLLALCGGQSMNEGTSMSPSGYHLCTHNETRTVSFLVVHKVPYSVSRPCGGWLLWKTCPVKLYKMIPQTEYKTVTEQVIRCCHGYVQVGRYCALPVNRSGEFSAKPGSCPTADGFYPRSEDCELDIDCPGWQKCCQRCGRSFCSDPAISSYYSKNGGNRLNATVTVKTEYQELMSRDEGLLNHTRLVQAMVTGALQSEVSIYYLSTWPVCPHRTATSLLIVCNFTLSLHNVTSKLNHLLKHIEEVSSVTVQDVDECAHSALRQCSPQANCSNTVGSYQCACRQEYIDVDPSNPGAHCSADTGVSTTLEPTPIIVSPSNATYPPDSSSNNTTGLYNSSGTSMTAAPSNATSVPHNSTHASPWTVSPSYETMNSTVESPVPTSTCTPPSISSLWSANVTGTSFTVCWSVWSQTNQTYLVVVSKGSEVIWTEETSDTMIDVSGLQPGWLYNVTVTPCACGSQGDTLHISVKTDVQTLDATARLTNINFTADLQNTSSQAYKSLSESIIHEIYQSLSPEMKAMVDLGQVTIEITSFSPGSVVVSFIIIFIPSQNQNINQVSTALLHSLLNSSKYTVDKNSTRINDFNECASGENDCSLFATCTNTWGSYTCACLNGFIDINPKRPGRICQAIATFGTMTSAQTTARTPSASEPAVTPTITTAAITTVEKSTSQIVSTTVSSSAQAATTTTPTSASPAPTTTTPATISITSTATSTTPATTTVPATVIAGPAITTAALITTVTPTTSSMTTKTTFTTPTTEAALTTALIPPPAITTTPQTIAIAPKTTTTTLRSATSDSMQGVLSVQCRIAAITVTVAKSFLLSSKIQEKSLYLGLPGCGVNGGNDTHVQLTVAWNECDTKLVHNETYYTASVMLFNTMQPYTSPSGTVEVPTKRLEVSIMCTYMKNILISADFSSMGYETIKDLIIMDSGSFQVTVQLMNGTMPLPQNYTLSREQPVVIEVSLNTSSDQIKLVIDKCWATSTQNPVDIPSHVFIENGCSLNTYTRVLMNGNSSRSRVSVKIFSFVNLNVIYLHCRVQICLQTGSDTCVPGCLQRTAQSVNAIATRFGSVGPIMKSDEEPLDKELNTIHIAGFACLGIGLSLFFIVGFACLFYCHRNRIGHYNFNVKPKEETFTYLVFNT